MLIVWHLGLASVATAQNNFFLTVQTTPSNSIPVNSLVTYSIGVTNLSSFDANNVFVTNTLPASVQIVGETPSQSGTVSTNGNSLIFFVGLIPTGFSATMFVTAQPTAAGFFTNVVSVFSPQLTNFITVNSILLATNPASFGDLAVSITSPTQTLFPGDWTAYGIHVTNLGPNTVTNIVLTNSLAVGAKLLGVSPSSQAFTLSNNLAIFPIASLTNGGFENLTVRVQLPTNSGPALFSAGVNASSSQDTNSANNFASTNILVSDYFPSSLLVVTNSPQTTNRQNGLIEQTILVSNVGTSNADSVRVIVTGLTNVPVAGFTNLLFNASGTNNGNPFIVYASTLAPNQSVELLLQFYVRTRSAFPFKNSQLQAYAVSLPNLIAPQNAATSTNLNFTRILPLPSGDMFLEFKSTVGKVYTIVYTDNMSFSNALMAVPSIIATANYVQWIDYGPPATISKPGSGMRAYRVFQNP